MANSKYYQLLKQDSEQWNNWRKQNSKNRRIDLSKTDLSWGYLCGVNLSDVNLTGANLSVANLENANFKGAKLTEADLRGANLEGANFKGANLKGANFEGANVKLANFEGTNFSEANLENICIGRSVIDGRGLDIKELVSIYLDIKELVSINTVIILEEVPYDKKIAILKAVRLLTGLGLKEAKDLVEATPRPIEIDKSMSQEAAVEMLEQAGAKIRLDLDLIAKTSSGFTWFSRKISSKQSESLI